MKKIHWTPETTMEISKKEEEKKGGGGMTGTAQSL
jgi:hypothetical protein